MGKEKPFNRIYRIKKMKRRVHGLRDLISTINHVLEAQDTKKKLLPKES